MRALILMIILLSTSTTLWTQIPQGGLPCDVFCAIANDNTCNAGGCASQVFTLPDCPHFYLVASSGPHCKVTVSLYTYPGGQFITSESNSDEQACGGTAWNEVLNLTAGAQYKIATCWESCSGYSCDECVGYIGEGRLWVNHP